MPSARQLAGRRAEEMVAAAMAARGWNCLARNLRTPYAEVDLVFEKPGELLLLIEVKARSSRGWLGPEDHLGPAQRRRLFRAAEWLLRRQTGVARWRLDLALVDLLGGMPVSWRLLEDIGLD